MSTQSEPIAVTDHGSVRLILVDNPPVNALGFAIRDGLARTLAEADADPDVGAVVVSTAGRNFFAGADIREFGQVPKPPRVFDVIAQIETMKTPVIAALKGYALGGGFELALGCHWRIAAPGSSFGFPEIRLGLIPGAGGTQRTPRLAGPLFALEMVHSGRTIDAEAALGHGLIDRIAEGDPVTAAIDFARERAGAEDALRRVRDRAVPAYDAEALDRECERIERRAGHREAPRAAVEAIRAALGEDFDAGFAKERALFEALMEGDQSKASRHAFFAERAAQQVPDIGREIEPLPVRQVAVLGAGVMGRGIALACLGGGYAVRLVEPNPEMLAAGAKAVRQTLERDRDRGRIDAEGFSDALARFETVEGDARAAGAADLVIEAAFEDLALKKDIFATLGETAREGAILATNTSSLNVNVIGAASGRASAVLGLHFFSPANIMKLLEIVRGEKTSKPAIATAIAFAKRIGKVPVVVGVCDGFVGNRMLARRHIAAERLLIEGALPQEVDAAWVDFGFPMGPFAMTDLAGVDTNHRVRKARGVGLAVHDTLYEMGRYGQKSGKGFYRYADDGRTPLPDPEVEAVIARASKEAGVTRRTIGAEEIVETLLFPMINEGARILGEGIAQRPGDIDVIWINGYGWPSWRGGPMYYADRVGLAHIRDRLAAMHARIGDPTLAPARLIEERAASGGTIGT